MYYLPSGNRLTMSKIKTYNKGPERRPVIIRGVKDCKRLLARIIREYQEEKISENKARTLTYVISKYVDIERTEKLDEIINRLDKLEERSGVLNGNIG